MKKILFNIALLTGLLTASSCGDEFLTLLPESNLTADTFFQTRSQYLQAVNAAYQPLLAMYSGYGNGKLWMYGEMRSDNTTFQGSANESTQTHRQFDHFLEGRDYANTFFTNSYTGIARCNTVLARIDNLPTATNPDVLNSAMTAADKAQFKGEVSYLRAFYYFNLVRLYGQVPLVLNEITNYTEALAAGSKRETVANIYTQIVADLTVAAASLPATVAAGDRGRPTKYTAKTLMADAYLTQGKYTEALTQLTGADGVIGKYSLVPVYANLWGPANEYNAESIWEISYFLDVTAANNSAMNDNMTPNDAGGAAVPTGGVAIADPTNAGWNIATSDLVNTFETGDVRRNMINRTFMSPTYSVIIPYTTKFFGSHTVALRYGNNFPVYRYAEVLLMAAECLNKTGQDPLALPYLNAVRARAGLAASALTGSALFNQIIHERRVELAFESKRWFDLVRTGTAEAVMKAHGAALKVDPNNPQGNGVTPISAYTNIPLTFVYPDREVQIIVPEL